MASFDVSKEVKLKELRDVEGDDEQECTLDGSVDGRGRPALRKSTGTWVAGYIIL
ncbi:hypothetical protein FRX31_004230, partial [Thalictrum thalictroides]